MKKIKTFEDACAALGISPSVPDVNGLPEDQRKAVIAHYKLLIIAKALNDGWAPNWNNWDEYKYYAWFTMGDDGGSPSSGFSYGAFVVDYSHSCVGSRLCFKSSELAEYAGKQFEELYKEYFLIG